MDKIKLLFILPVLSAASIWQASAQDGEARMQLTPWVGAFLSHASSADLPVVNGEGVVEARMASSPVLGADMEVQLPLPFLSLRGSLGAAIFTSVEFANWDGTYSRGTNHHSLGNPQGVGSSVWLLSGSAVLKPWAGSPGPYLLAGIGLKRYNYSNIASELKDVLSNNRTRVSFQIGIGIPASRRLRIEVSDHISHQNFVFEVPQMVRLQEPMQMQNDFVITVGYRLGMR